MERLGLDEDARGGDEDVGLALEFLAYLCVRLGGEALGDFASAASSSAGKRAGFGVGAAGHVWGHVDAHIGVVAEKFDALAHVKATGENSWQQKVGMCSLIVAFHAAKAPGNANPGDVLTKTGALRALCAAFTAPDNATAPHSEALRRAVLLVAAAAPETVDFIAAVPGLRSEVESRDEFRSPGGSLAAHGALWELLLPAREPPGRRLSVRARRGSRPFWIRGCPAPEDAEVRRRRSVYSERRRRRRGARRRCGDAGARSTGCCAMR